MNQITIVGERINGTRKSIAEFIRARDVDAIQNEAKLQAEAGATYLDVNAGSTVTDEVEDLVWLAKTVESCVDIPLAIDSSDMEAMAAAAKLTSKPPMLNSVNGEPERIETVIPLAKECDASVIALLMEEDDMPEGVSDRMKIAERLVDEATKAGLALDKIHFDPCVLAASMSFDQPMIVLDTIRELKKTWPEAHIVSGLSNVSFGLPMRKLINRTYFAMMIAAGADGFILDPLEPTMRAAITATRVLIGEDIGGMEYIGKFRNGQLEG